MNDKIRVFHSAHGAANAIMALGVAAGCFSEEKLDVVMQETALTGVAMSRMMAGDAEFVVVGSVPILDAARAGQEPVVVMSMEAENVFGIIGAKGVDTPSKLRGRMIAISGHHEQDDLMMRRALSEWGIDPDRDVTLEAKGSRGKCWDAVMSGEAAAMTATIPQPILARAVGLPVLKDYAEAHEPFQLGALVTTRRFCTERTEQLGRVLTGQLKAIRLFQSDFDAALPHLKARSKLTDVGVLRETHRMFAEAIDHYIPNPEALRAVVRYLETIFGETVDVDIGRIVDPSFARSLEARPKPVA